MVKNNIIKFTVTKEQKEQIKTRARINGYLTISSYLRELAMSADFLIKFNHLYNKIMQNETKRTKNT